MTQKHLNKLISAQLVHKINFNPGKKDGKLDADNEYLLYFLSDGNVRWMDLNTLLYHKKEAELAYVNFIINKRAEVSQEWNAATRRWTTEIDRRLKDRSALDRIRALDGRHTTFATYTISQFSHTESVALELKQIRVPQVNTCLQVQVPQVNTRSQMLLVSLVTFGIKWKLTDKFKLIDRPIHK
ncbi:hypothetical protein ACR2XN_28670 [Klebsiella pneumoniae]